VLTVLCAIQAIRYARARQFDAHRVWALRLFALAIGSWLYRMDYGFWYLFMGGAGHADDFRGPFDQVMVFFFYVPNLIVAEMALRSARKNASVSRKVAATGVYVAATDTCWSEPTTSRSTTGAQQYGNASPDEAPRPGRP
jgi:hypothetical protein